MTENKRFINDIENGRLVDTENELSTIDYSDSVDFYELWEFLNKLNDEIKELEMEYRRLVRFLMKNGYTISDYLDYCEENEFK